MTSEQFVKQVYPDAKAHRGQSCYGYYNAHKPTIIKATNNIGMLVNIGYGDNESKAWVDAKKNIKERR